MLKKNFELTLKLLQSFFKANKIDYLFVHFYKVSLPWEDLKFKQYNKFLDLTKVLNLGFIKGVEDSHPSYNECMAIKDEIVKKVNEIYG